jgi:TolB-like protein/Flp pilus assembly protein TadD
LAIGAALAAVAIASGIAIWMLRGSGAAPIVRSIAVLPLANLSGDQDQTYFAEGMTDALITRLAESSDLRVISRTSSMQYRGTTKGAREIARELDVDAMVEGSVQYSNGRVRITAQLIHAPTDRHLWARSYERELTDVLALQDEVARVIAGEIRARTAAEIIPVAGQVSSEAYLAYLRGRYFWNRRTAEGFKRAAEYFSRAIELDPRYARAYAGLADGYLMLNAYHGLPPGEAFPKAEEMARKALELNPQLSEAHATLGYIRRDYYWDFDGAGREFRRAIELNPSYVTAYHWYAELLTITGRLDEALQTIRTGQRLDPLSLVVNAAVGYTFYYAGQYDQAIEQCNRVLEMDPQFVLALLYLGLAYEQKGLFEQALAVFDRLPNESFQYGGRQAVVGHALAAAGRSEEARGLLAELQRMAREGYVPPSHIALVHQRLGEVDQAMALLDQAVEARDNFLLYFNVDPRIAPMRTDPRFADLLRRIGFDPAAAPATAPSEQ